MYIAEDSHIEIRLSTVSKIVNERKYCKVFEVLSKVNNTVD